ncbi:hypothetical protein PAXRUDRAFT_826269 [Paxillus rubicundulus Ve08.2h10]|uniref:F-box domain-containing protein n=1 Tax=Paxillus rubicundulus Ve08.2h10 TaxID=930991 RepID=A0A0D0E4K3_9AGAM|nr:hypothetical protein PAXRUDRAFT_826269 [Paxillus rubicundulus Ve08.2h10]
MTLAFIHLPQDALILICLHLSVGDILNLMQTCRVIHALGSLDYLWHRLLANWDIPLDVPLNVDLVTLPSDFLRNAVVKALELDRRWRDSSSHLHYAQRIISPNSSFVDGLRLLPGGRWLITIQYEQTTRTHITLWSMKDPSEAHPTFQESVIGRVRFLQAHHHELDQITIGIAFARGTMETIRVYNVLLQDDSSNVPQHPLAFEAASEELSTFGRIAGMKICGKVMTVVFAPLSPSQDEGKIVCVNLLSKIAAIIQCPDWSFACGRVKLFHRHFAVITSRYTPQNASACIYYHGLPSVIIDANPPSTAPCWPTTLPINSSPIASISWKADSTLVFELSDDMLTNTGDTCSFTMLGGPTHQYGNRTATSIVVLRVSFNGANVSCNPTSVTCRSLPFISEVRASPSGRRAVWLCPDPDTQECTLMKFASGRTSEAHELAPCVSTLMPSFSGLPFNPRDIHSFAFDEISCRLAVSLPSGELYILQY